MLSSGKVLFISQVTEDIVDKFNKEGGVRCMMIIKHKTVFSRATTMKVVGKGKFICKIHIKLVMLDLGKIRSLKSIRII